MSSSKSKKKAGIPEKTESEKRGKESFSLEKIDIFLPIVAILSLINPIRAAFSQYYLLAYEDDIMWVYWVSQHISEPLSLLSHGPGSGFRVTINLLYAMGYTLWGSNEVYYYLLSGVLFAGSMVFLYSLIKLLSDRTAGMIAVLLYLFLDASFILVWKMNFITFTAELFFITASLYYFIHYFNNNDNKSLVLAIPCAILAFFSKEPSILIIPTVNILYLAHKWKSLPISENIKKSMLVLNVIPVLSMILVMSVFSTSVGISKTTPLTELFTSRLTFYIEQELSWQLKNPYIFLLACAGTFYFYPFKQKMYGNVPVETIKNVVPVLLVGVVFISSVFKIGNIYSLAGVLLITLLLAVSFIFGSLNQRLGIAWFGAGLVPLLFTSLPVQPTYLAEPNLGMCLFIGVTLSKYLQHVRSEYLDIFATSSKSRSKSRPNPSDDKAPQSLRLVTITLILLVILFQLSQVPAQISNTNYYQKTVADRQTTFKEAVEYLGEHVPANGVIYYISSEQRETVGGGQIDADNLHEMLCLKGRCDIEVRSLDQLDESAIGKQNHEFIALLSTLDVYLFNEKYGYLIKDGGFVSKKVIKNDEQYAAILEI